ncbi:MAG: hypothetical protein ACO1N0_09210 [Fluviicola sp.]
MKALHISNPCNESWDKMQPQSKGRLCHTCERKVVNFALMDNEEISRYIQANNSERICGRLKTSQLKRPLPVSVNFSLRSVLMGASLSGALLLESCDTVKQADQPTVSQQTKPNSDKETYYDHRSDTLISGIVRKSDWTKAWKAEITLYYDTDFLNADTLYADNKGRFSIPIRSGKVPGIIEFTHGDEYFTLDVRKTEKLQNLVIELEELMTIGEVIILDR